MKNIMKKLFSITLVIVLLLSCNITALAAGTFNAGVSIERDGNTITVTIAEQNDEFLAAQSPRLSIVCDFETAAVTHNGKTVTSFLEDGMVSFSVQASGTYVITGSGKVGCTHPDENSDHICDDCGCNLGAVLEGAIVGLKDSIHMKVYFSLSDDVLADEDAYLQITRPDGTVEKIPVKDAAANNGYHGFTAEFSAKEMTDVVCIQMIMGDGSASQIYRYSLRNYADIILSDSANYSDADRTMVKAMLLYGAYAQKHFDYRTDTLADDGLNLTGFDLDSVTADTLENYADSRKQGTEKVVFMGSSLLLKSETILRLFFKIDPSVVSKVTFTANGKQLNMQPSGSFYYVDITGIAAKNLSDHVSVTISDGTTTTATVTYNPLSYCYTVLAASENHTESLRDVVKALYLYNQTAKAYFGA